MKNKISDYLTDVMKEMKKVTWPTKEELKDSTVIVLLSSVIFSLFIFAIDKVIGQVMTLVLGG